MSQSRVIVIGAGVGGLACALELKRRGFDVLVLERHAEVGGKASERRANGFRWDEGPSIVVMPWVYRELFAASGLDPDAYLPMKRLDPAFRVQLPGGQEVVLPAAIEGVRDAFGAIDARDAAGLDRFLARVDRFARVMGHSYCDRPLERWSQVLFSRLMVSAAIISPYQSYEAIIARYFQSTAVRELLHGFPTYSGFAPRQAPGSLVVIPWTILREGVWYPERGGVAEIPRSIARASADVGVEVRRGVEAEAIELDATGRVSGVATSSGHLPTRLVVSNSDYVHTYRMLRTEWALPSPVAAVRRGDATPSFTYFTVQLGCDRKWDRLDHHYLVMTSAASASLDEVFQAGTYPSDPPIYVNTTSATCPDDAPPGGCNPFLVVGVPPLAAGQVLNGDVCPNEYADGLIERLERSGVPGLSAATVERHLTTPRDWERRFHAFRGSIYGLGVEHNVLGGAFRPLNQCRHVPGLYFAGGGVQPGAGLPMVVQSGKITAGLVARDRARKSG